MSGKVNAMLIPELFKQMQVSPRVSFWISSAALCIVLLNNHIYMANVQAREKEAHLLMERNIAEQDALGKRERVLRTWEMQLLARETELKALIERLSRKPVSQSDPSRG